MFMINGKLERGLKYIVVSNCKVWLRIADLGRRRRWSIRLSSLSIIIWWGMRKMGLS